MPIAIDPTKVFDYVLECDRKQPCECGGEEKECAECKGTGFKNTPRDQQTIFKLKVLKARELAQLEDNLSSVSVAEDGMPKVKVNAGTQVLRILGMGLTGWENLKDKGGKAIEFKTNGTINWDYLKQDWRRELANEITEQTRLGEELVKNLKSEQAF